MSNNIAINTALSLQRMHVLSPLRHHFIDPGLSERGLPKTGFSQLGLY